MRFFILLAFFFLFLISAKGQVGDCYPNRVVEFNTVFALRCPTSYQDIYGMGIGTNCLHELDELVGKFKKEDLAQWNLLKNQYCSAQDGWEQIAPCIHGAPPPCCDAPPDKQPWKKVDPEVAFSKYKAKMKEVYDQRHKELFTASRNCYERYRQDNNSAFANVYKEDLKYLTVLESSYPQDGLIHFFKDEISKLKNAYDYELKAHNSTSHDLAKLLEQAQELEKKIQAEINSQKRNNLKIPCSNGKCPPGYKCANGFCDKDAVDKNNEQKLPCDNGKCPPGYDCEWGFCKKYNGIAKKDDGITVACNNGKCPPGYGCKHGECVKGYIVPMGTIEGKLLCESNKPVKNVFVSIKSSENSYSATTDDNGIYEVKVVAENTYTITSENKTVSLYCPDKGMKNAPDILIAKCNNIEHKYAYAYWVGPDPITNELFKVYYYSNIYDVSICDVKCISRKFLAGLKSRINFDFSVITKQIYEDGQSFECPTFNTEEEVRNWRNDIISKFDKTECIP